MGKKASHHQQQPFLKPKPKPKPKPSSENDKKQLHTLIKVLKPKVYITDSSTFKALVQELTGNVTTPISSFPSPPLPPHPQLIPITHIDDDELDHLVCHPLPPHSQLPVTHIDDDDDDELDHLVNCHETSSLELSVDSYIPTPVTMLEGSPDLSLPTPFTACSHVHDHQMDFSQSKDDIDLSWLLELEPFPFCDHAYAPPIQQEICVYDYDISGFI